MKSTSPLTTTQKSSASRTERAVSLQFSVYRMPTAILRAVLA